MIRPDKEIIKSFTEYRLDNLRDFYIDGRFKFDINNRDKCTDDKLFMDAFGYYIYELFIKKRHELIIPKEFYYDDIDDIFIVDVTVNDRNNENLTISDDSYKNFGFRIKEYYNLENKINKYHKIYREYMIGSILSNLRDKLPNIIYTFPLIEEQEIFTIFKNSNYELTDKYYDVGKYPNIVILEERTSKTTFEKMILNGRFKMKHMLNVLLQLILTLNMINQEYPFSHNDLNFNNIIIEKLKKKKLLLYKVKINNEITIVKFKTRYIAKIKNFNKSSMIININRRSVYSYNIDEDNVYYGKIPSPEDDIIQLVGRLYRYDDELFFPILKYIFNSRDITEDYIDNRKETNFHMDKRYINTVRKYDMILDYIIGYNNIMNYFDDIEYTDDDLNLRYKDCNNMLISNEAEYITENLNIIIVSRDNLVSIINDSLQDEEYDKIKYFSDYIYDRINELYTDDMNIAEDLLVKTVADSNTIKNVSESVYLILSRISIVSLIYLYISNIYENEIELNRLESLLQLYIDAGDYYDIERFIDNIEFYTLSRNISSGIRKIHLEIFRLFIEINAMNKR